MADTIADTIRVKMNLTQKTCDQAELLRQRFGYVSKAQAVSMSMSLVALLADAVGNDGMLIVRMPNGKLEKLVIPELTR